MITITRLGISVIFCLNTGVLTAEPIALSPASVFGNHMILQRDKPVPIWGSATEGALVSVEFAGQVHQTTVGSDGTWRVDLIPLKTSSVPRELRVIAAHRSDAVTNCFADVLVGDVWLASGQSNMEMSMTSFLPWHEGVLNFEEEIADAEYPQIRLFHTARSPSWKLQDSLIGSWRVCSPESVRYFSGIAYYYARKLYQDTGIPQGVLLSALGGTPIRSWRNPCRGLQFEQDLQSMQQDQERIAEYSNEISVYDASISAYAETWLANPNPQAVLQPTVPFSGYNYLCGGCYNGMLAAAAPFAISGVIWTQGEADAGSDEYGLKLSDFVEQFRDEWDDGSLFFFYSQLANHDPFISHPDRVSWGQYWAKMRNIQLSVLRMTTNTGMAVAADVGETDQIHPRDKKTVGERLALWALAKYYDQDLVYSGPLARSIQVSDALAIIDFDHVDGGLEIHNAATLDGFELAGADGVFYPAVAEIDGEQVRVAVPEVSQPVAVRYAWANDPICTLYNKAGLPASPFVLTNSVLSNVFGFEEGVLDPWKAFGAPSWTVSDNAPYSGVYHAELSTDGTTHAYSAIYYESSAEEGQKWDASIYARLVETPGPCCTGSL